MIGMVRNAALKVLAASMAFGAMAPVAQAQENCERYGFLALKQTRENEKRKCGHTGPRWNTDLNAHVAWCKSVGPAEWKSELRERSKALAACKR